MIINHEYYNSPDFHISNYGVIELDKQCFILITYTKYLPSERGTERWLLFFSMTHLNISLNNRQVM